MLPPPQMFCRALILLRNRGMLPPLTLLELFFGLFRCADRLLRRTLFHYIVQDVKNINAKQQNTKLNLVCRRSCSESSVPTRHVSEGAAPRPYCFTPRPIYIAPCPN